MRPNRQRSASAICEASGPQNSHRNREPSTAHAQETKMSRWPGDPSKEITPFGDLCRGNLMARIPSKGNATTEERLVRLLRLNRIRGWRRNPPMQGKPDFAWPQERLAVFVDGCFWHGHSCGRNLHPRTNARAWREKIKSNTLRDRRSSALLRRKGWKVMRVWECTLAKYPDRCMRRVQNALSKRHHSAHGRPSNLIQTSRGG